MQTSNFKQPFVIAVVIILAVTVIAVGLNSFTGQASWFSNFRRAPQMEVERPVQIDNQIIFGDGYGQINLGNFLEFNIKSSGSNFESYKSIDDIDRDNQYLDVSLPGYSITSGIIKDLYLTEAAAERNRPDMVGKKVLQIRASGQSDKGFGFTRNVRNVVETDTIYLAIQNDGSLGIYGQEQDGNDAILIRTLNRGSMADIGELQDEDDFCRLNGPECRITISWGEN